MTRLMTMMTVSASLMIGACAPTTISPNWGTAYQQMRAGQVLNPSAGEQLNPVEGLDGVASATAMGEYRKSFEKPKVDLQRSVVSSGVKTN